MSTLTKIDPLDARFIHAARVCKAVRYIEQHAHFHLHDEQLLQACVASLITDHGIWDVRLAHDIAMTALAEVQVRSLPAWIDISLSTSLVCRVIDPVSNRVASFTASELIQIAQQRADARAEAAPSNSGALNARSLN